MYEDFPSKGVVNEPESGEPRRKSWRPRYQFEPKQERKTVFRPRHAIEEVYGRKGWVELMKKVHDRKDRTPELPYVSPGAGVISLGAARYLNEAEQKRSADAPYRTDISDEVVYDPFIE